MWRVASLVCAFAVVGCGGSDPSSDIDEREGEFAVAIARADFDARQNVARTADLVLEVRNTGDETIEDLAITVWTGDAGVEAAKPAGSFNAGAGDPVWVPKPGFPKLLAGGTTIANADDAPSAGAVAAQTDTFTFGALEAGKSRSIVWRVTPVKAGRYKLNYSVAAGLSGRAKAVTDSGDPAAGDFAVRIRSQPAR